MGTTDPGHETEVGLWKSKVSLLCANYDIAEESKFETASKSFSIYCSYGWFFSWPEGILQNVEDFISDVELVILFHESFDICSGTENFRMIAFDNNSIDIRVFLKIS